MRSLPRVLLAAVALLPAMALLATSPAVLNGCPLQGVTRNSETQTDAANGSLRDGQNRTQAKIQRVEISPREQAIEVRVWGDGPLRYRAFPLSHPDRLVLDFAGALASAKPRQVTSALEPILGVRLGQFSPDVARVVIDLKQKFPYTMNQGSNFVTVVFGHATETSLGAVSDGKGTLIPDTVHTELPPPSIAAEDLNEYVRERRTQPQAVGIGPADDPATPSSPHFSEARPAEGEGSTPTLPTHASEVTFPLRRAEAQSSLWSPPEPDYVIGIDDVLSIIVREEFHSSRGVFVRPDGKISLPMIGEVKAEGLTPAALEGLLATELRSYLYEPEVTVAVQEMRRQTFNILGEVNRPGSYQVSKPMTVLDAISLAGGLRDFAEATKIYVVRVGPDGSRNRLPFNYKRAIQGAREQGSIEVEARDTIVVP
jgi:polysaccharide biosynthesis/export protein